MPVSHGDTIKRSKSTKKKKKKNELDRYGLRTARGYAAGRRGEKVAEWTRCSNARPSMAPAVERKLNPMPGNRNGAGGGGNRIQRPEEYDIHCRDGRRSNTRLTRWQSSGVPERPKHSIPGMHMTTVNSASILVYRYESRVGGVSISA